MEIQNVNAVNLSPDSSAPKTKTKKLCEVPASRLSGFPSALPECFCSPCRVLLLIPTPNTPTNKNVIEEGGEQGRGERSQGREVKNEESFFFFFFFKLLFLYFWWS